MSPQPKVGDRGESGYVVLTLKDGLGNPIAVPSRLTASPAGETPGRPRKAAGRAGEVASFRLDSASSFLPATTSSRPRPRATSRPLRRSRSVRARNPSGTSTSAPPIRTSPEATSRSARSGRSTTRIDRLSGREWFAKKVKLTKREWLYHVAVPAKVADPQRPVTQVPGILVTPDQPVTVGIVLALPRDTKPGERSRFSVIQRRGEDIVGGSTYDVRVAPRAVPIR